MEQCSNCKCSEVNHLLNFDSELGILLCDQCIENACLVILDSPDPSNWKVLTTEGECIFCTQEKPTRSKLVISKNGFILCEACLEVSCDCLEEKFESEKFGELAVRLKEAFIDQKKPFTKKATDFLRKWFR